MKQGWYIVNKHGKCVSCDVVEIHSTESEAYSAEMWMIVYLRSLGAELLNENDGGLGQSRGKTWKLSEETRKRQSIAQKGHHVSEEQN